MRSRSTVLALLGPVALSLAVAGPATAAIVSADSAPVSTVATTASSHAATTHDMAGMTDAEMAAMHAAAPVAKGAVVREYRRSGTQALPKIKGEVGPGFSITINKSRVPAGRYKFIVQDLSDDHNFHLTGPGVDERTSVDFEGKVVWKLRLKEGEYLAVCDPHSGSMRTTLEVTA